LAAADQVTCASATPLGVGEAAVITLQATVAGVPAPAAYVNQAAVSGQLADLDQSNNRATAATSVVSAPVGNLWATKTGPASVRAGASFDYVIEFGNNGNGEAADWSVTDLLDPGLVFVTASAALVDPADSDIALACQLAPLQGPGVGPGGGMVTCAAPNNALLPAGARGAITLTVQAPTTVPVSPLAIDNTACASADVQLAVSDDCSTHQVQVRKVYSTIAGRVFVDSASPAQTPVSALAVYQPGVSQPIAGVTISLFAADAQGAPTGEVLATTMTSPDGTYAFTGLEAGFYALVQTQPAGWESTGSRPGTINGVPTGVGSTSGAEFGVAANSIHAIELLDGVNAIDNNFAEFRPGDIGNLIWADLDNDGVAEDGEPGIGQVELSLYLVSEGVVADQPLAVTVSDATGAYLFTGLGQGTYEVRVADSGLNGSGLFSTAPLDPGTADHMAKPTTGYQVVLNELNPSDLTADFGFGESPPLPPVANTLTVLKVDPSQGALDGAQFQLLADNNGSPGAVLTNQPVTQVKAGQFEIADLGAGTYWIDEIQAPSGYRQLGSAVQIQVAPGGATVLSDQPLVSANGTTLTVVNVPDLVWALPATGGTSWPWQWLAGLAIVTAGAIAIRHRRLAGQPWDNHVGPRPWWQVTPGLTNPGRRQAHCLLYHPGIDARSRAILRVTPLVRCLKPRMTRPWRRWRSRGGPPIE
jgi:uncharacterized repeat protein (TIGR01451 family)